VLWFHGVIYVVFVHKKMHLESVKPTPFQILYPDNKIKSCTLDGTFDLVPQDNIRISEDQNEKWCQT
jgi:hypothetical protein